MRVGRGPCLQITTGAGVPRNQRIQKLLKANSRYLQRAISAEAEVARLRRKLAGTSEGRALRLLEGDA